MTRRAADNDETTEKDNSTTRLLSRVFGLLDILSDKSDGATGLSELAKSAQLPMSTAHRLVRMLVVTGKAERSPAGYRLVRPVRADGERCESASTVRDWILPGMLDLYERTHGAVHLAILDGSKVRYLEKLAGRGSVRLPTRRGGIAPAHCTAIGKALLANTAESMADLDTTRRFTLSTITEKAVLAAELAEVKRSGFAIDRGEYVAGVACVAAPVLLPGKRVAAVSVSNAVGRLDIRVMGQHIRRVVSAMCSEGRL